MNTRCVFPLVMVAAMVLFTACTNEDDGPINNTSGDKASLSVRMTDAPAAYDAVFVTFSEIAVHHSGEGWIVVSGDPVTINLLEWNNGNSIELGRTDLEAGHITQVRLMVTDASLVVDGETHELAIPSADQTGLKIITNFELEAGSSYTLMLDFDAHHSIVVMGPPSNPNGYKLKPTIRAVEVAATGSIAGTIVNVADAPLAVVSQGGVEVTSTPVIASDGSFRIAYLAPGMYDLKVVNTLGLEVIVGGIEVKAGQTTNVGALVLL
ncbi:MAG: DUF4382 domain-containing protein [Bacteroidota bacterium]|nr:DUF4382 domain-containing protein [Bacteroidota bacterium]